MTRKLICITALFICSIFFSFVPVVKAKDMILPEGQSEIDINSFCFPDDNFRQFILDQGYDLDSDMKLSMSELANVTVMDCEGITDDSRIRDLTGIEYFRCLTRLVCRNNLLQKLDVSKLTELVYLDCSSNMIVSLDVRYNTALETLNCKENEMVSLNAAGCYSLVSLDCEKNELTMLDIRNCSQLDNLSCRSNKLSVLNITDTPFIRNYILTTPRIDNGSYIVYGEYTKAGKEPGAEPLTTLYHVEMDPETALYSNDTGRNLDTGINADPFLITTIIFAYVLTGHFAEGKKSGWLEN